MNKLNSCFLLALILSVSFSTLGKSVYGDITPYVYEDFENWNINGWYVDNATGGLTIPYNTGVFDNNCARFNNSASFDIQTISKGNYSIPYLEQDNITVIFHFNLVSYREAFDGNYKNIYQIFVGYGDLAGNCAVTYYNANPVFTYVGSDYTTTNFNITYNTWYRVQIDIISGSLSGIEKCTITNVLTGVSTLMFDWSGDNSWLDPINAFWIGKIHPETLLSFDLLVDYIIIADYGYIFSLSTPVVPAWYENITFDLILLFTALGMTFGGAVWFVLKVREHNDIYQIVNGLIICIVGIAITYGWFMNYA